MADNAQRTPGSGEAIAADEVTDGTLGSCKVQFVKLMDGTIDGTAKALVDTNGLKVAVSNASIAGSAGSANAGVLSVQGIASMTPLLMQGQQSALQSGNITSSSTTIGPYVASNYNIATVTVHGTYAGVNFGFWGSDDGGTTWYPLQGVRTDSFYAESTSGVLTANTSRAWDIPVGAFTHFKVVSTAWTSGTAVIGVGMQSMPYEPSPTVGLASIAGTTPDVNTGAASAGTLRTVLATRHEAAATPVAARLSADGTNFNATGYPIFTQMIPGSVAANALSTFYYSTTGVVDARNIKASAGSLYGMFITNQVAAVTYIQFFNTAGSPTLGTSVIFSLAVPAGAGTGLLIMMPGDYAIANFATGIAWGAATAINGSSAPATAPVGVCFYK